MKPVIRYTFGFVASLVLSIVAFLLVTTGILVGPTLIVSVVVLALVQLIVQLVCFLHLGEGASTKYRLFSFLAMFIILVIIVVGSLWIMNNLDYNMMHRTDEYLMQQRNKGF